MIFNYKSPDSQEVIEATFKTQRVVIAFLCLLLAPLSIGFGLFGINVNPSGWYNSVSDTYYANSKSIMIGVLFLTSYYFFTYRGYDWRDRLVNWISAFTALGVIMFPNRGYDGMFNFTGEESLCNSLHVISALILFSSFFVNCMWLFCLGDTTNKTKKKKNICFRISGVGILVGGVVLAFKIFGFLPDYFIGISEFIMLSSYSFAWFVKSGLVFKEQ